VNVQDTSKQAYVQGSSAFASLRDLIFDFVQRNPDKTQAAARAEFDLPPNTISARYNELEVEYKLIIKSGKTHEPLCDGRLMNTYRVIDGDLTITSDFGDDKEEYPFDDTLDFGV